MLPLAGITVVALEQAVAAPFATRQLADLGARVIKVERPGTGDFARRYDSTVKGLSSHFVWLNRSKESLTLDLKHPEAAAILSKLIDQADVFVQNLAPGAAARLNLEAKTLTARHPRLIVCAISGYGSSGPYRDRRAYDLLVQCETGLVSTTGTEDTPSKAGISAADIAAGMYAYSGILTALYRRERTGRGAALEVSLFDALGEWMGYPAYFTAYGGTAPARTGASHATIAPYGPFATGDGKGVNLGIQNEREWTRFCESVLQQPALVTDSRFCNVTNRVAHRAALDAAIREVFGKLTRAEIVARLDRAQIANASQNTMQEFWDHPQLAARDRWRNVGSPVGPIRALLPPVLMNDAESRMDPIPDVGEHTEGILKALGYTAAQITELRAEAVI
ncbi:MAG: CaiB/BaiF CoA-transferase family protein [Sulfuricaulis sp.]|uniref:CaiB/BaiF CoA transferase family protein n=1 Tax=Sulfuricaulis sp. TaxID=2003553 RepID=UPI0034A18DA4